MKQRTYSQPAKRLTKKIINRLERGTRSTAVTKMIRRLHVSQRRSLWGAKRSRSRMRSGAILVELFDNLETADRRTLDGNRHPLSSVARRRKIVAFRRNESSPPRWVVANVWGFFDEFVRWLASLSTQSLNHFADKMSKAEALNAEITCILNSLPTGACQALRPEPPPPATARKHRLAATVRT
jgi:hypothetical protein